MLYLKVSAAAMDIGMTTCVVELYPFTSSIFLCNTWLVRLLKHASLNRDKFTLGNFSLQSTSIHMSSNPPYSQTLIIKYEYEHTRTQSYIDNRQNKMEYDRK